MSALGSLVFALTASAAFAVGTCSPHDGKNCDASVMLQSTLEQHLELDSDVAVVEHMEMQELQGLRIILQEAQEALDFSAGGPGEYGDENCPCVGIDDIQGTTVVHISKNKTKEHKADVGASCKAWEKGWHPSCKVDKPPAWCSQKWCYVDPCNCKKIADVPKPSDYLPKARYMGKPLHYSYATCGGSDSWTSDKKRKALKHVKETCAEKVESKMWGEEDCRCVGIGPQPGTTNVTIGKKQVPFPASTGSFCHKWEEQTHPSCADKDGKALAKAPKWCSQAWCYVDPCKCKSATPPKTTSYLPKANYQGKPVYYSYVTCGGADHFSAGDEKACVNKKTKDECATLKKCAWDGKGCLGKDLVETCKKAEKDQKGSGLNKIFENVKKGISDGVAAVTNAAKKVAHTVADGAKKGWKEIKEVAKKVVKSKDAEKAKEEVEKEVKKDVEKAKEEILKNDAFAPKVLAAVVLSMIAFLQ